MCNINRDRPSAKAVDAAIKVAQIRGEVKLFQKTPGNPFDFLISGPGGSAEICARRTRRLHGSLAEIADDYGEPLALISAATPSPGISHEFWLWSPYGTMRFFRVVGSVLTELDRLGMVRNPLVAGKVDMRKMVGAKRVGDAAPGKGGVTEKTADTSVTLQSPGTSEQVSLAGQTGGKEPPYIRYLRRRNRERAASAGPPTDPSQKMTDGGIPGTLPSYDGGKTPPS